MTKTPEAEFNKIIRHQVPHEITLSFNFTL
jgi:hypothetical protein